MTPRQDSFGYQKQKYCAHNDSDITVHCEEQTNKQSTEGIRRIRKANLVAGKTFVIISQEIVEKLCINEDTWFQQDVTSDGIVLRILDRNGDGGLSQ